MKNIPSFRQKRAILIAPCILSPGLQVEAKPGEHWGYPFVRMAMENNVNQILLPCPESMFGGFREGLQRDKHGIDYYMSLDGYQEHCILLARKSIQMILDMQSGGYNFIGLLGVEHSPTCAVNYMYSKQGMLKRSGIFYGLLESGLEQHGLLLTPIGINRTHPRKALTLLERALSHSKEK